MVTALLPLAQGVAVFAHLQRAANTSTGIGTEIRTRNQMMADTLVTRITGQDHAHQVPVSINMTITADALLRNGNEPAHLENFGPIPAEYARAVVAGEPPGTAALLQPLEVQRARAWITRVLVDPITGVATNIDSRRREFNGIARRFLTVRDRVCRHPYCASPIQHADHIVPHREGGPTSIDNGESLCERGNYVKDMPGWSTRAGGRPGEVVTTTPTGHSYRTMPPHQTGMPGRTVRLRATPPDGSAGSWRG